MPDLISQLEQSRTERKAAEASALQQQRRRFRETVMQLAVNPKPSASELADLDAQAAELGLSQHDLRVAVEAAQSAQQLLATARRWPAAAAEQHEAADRYNKAVAKWQAKRKAELDPLQSAAAVAKAKAVECEQAVRQLEMAINQSPDILGDLRIALHEVYTAVGN